MDNTNKNCNCVTIKERKIMIYVIILFIILLYISLFFIHNIIGIGMVRHAQSVEIDYPEKTDENDIDDGSVDENNNFYNNKNVAGKDTQVDKNTNSENNVDNDIIVDNSCRFRVLEGTQEWSNLKELSIFNNSYFQDKSIIAPGVSGNYSFTVENYSDTKIKYNIRFMEENNYNINMVYKLKLNGSYIVGSENQWVKYKDLCKDGLIVNNHTNDLFTIEWKWEDNYNDTIIGETEGADYKLKVQLNAEDYEH